MEDAVLRETPQGQADVGEQNQPPVSAPEPVHGAGGALPDDLAEKLPEQPSERAAGKTAEQPSEGTAGRSAEQPAGGSAEQASEDPAGRSAEQASEGLAGEKPPGEYRKKLSATIVAVVKLLEGASAGLILFGIVKLLFPLFGYFREGITGLNLIYEELTGTVGQGSLPLPSGIAEIINVDSYTSYLKNGLALPGILLILFGTALAVGLVLTVIEAFLGLALRFAGRGAGAMGGIHRFRFALTIFHMALFTFEFTIFFLSADRMAAATGADVFSMRIFLAVFGVLYYLVTGLIACYHSDIGKAMKTVEYECGAGQPGEMEHTHLSGISFLGGSCYALLLLVLILGYFFSADLAGGDMQTLSVLSGIGDGMISLLLPGAVSLLLALKYFSVSRCSRNLKREH